ncbi:hypothetical protein cypCar_00040122 [Cyprinus carpio]|nr:hypothetical protein cypCar_00040122 [Cyprinus carpio]
MEGTSGVDETHVFISSGENVRLPCNNALPGCTSTTWNYNRLRNSAAAEMIAGGKKKQDTERHERLSLGSDCSLNIRNVTKEDYGSYTCRQYVNGQQGTDARVFLHVLHVSPSSSQNEISPGSFVTLSCQLYSFAGASCDDLIRSKGIQLIWVNQTGVKLTIADSRYQISAPGHCIRNLTAKLLNEDDKRKWRCEITHRNQVKTSDTYAAKISGTARVVLCFESGGSDSLLNVLKSFTADSGVFQSTGYAASRTCDLMFMRSHDSTEKPVSKSMLAMSSEAVFLLLELELLLR